jgi:hypothetical protein
MEAFLLPIPSRSDDGEKKIEVGLPGKPKIPSRRVYTVDLLRRKIQNLGRNCQDDFAGTGVIDGVTLPISGLADFVEGMTAALE